MAQLVERLPSMQNVQVPPEEALGKEELSLGVVALLCLVSVTEHACTCTCTVCESTCTCDCYVLKVSAPPTHLPPSLSLPPFPLQVPPMQSWAVQGSPTWWWQTQWSRRTSPSPPPGSWWSSSSGSGRASRLRPAQMSRSTRRRWGLPPSLSLFVSVSATYPCPCLSVHPLIHPSIPMCLPAYLCLSVSICLSVCLSICLLVCTCTSVCLSLCWSVCLTD